MAKNVPSTAQDGSRAHFFTVPWWQHGALIEGKTPNMQYMNENAVRARAGLLNVVAWTVLLILSTVDEPGFILYTIAPVVLWDFLTASVIGLTPLAPFGVLGTWLTWSTPPVWKPAGPKRFAWVLGILMVGSCMSFGSQKMINTVRFHVGACVLLTWLESSLGFCAGCWMWNNYVAQLLGKEECQECKMEFAAKVVAPTGSKNGVVPPASTAAAEVDALIAGNPVLVFTKTTCPHCVRAKRCLDGLGATYETCALDACPDPAGYAAALVALTNRKTVPNVFVNGSSIGGADDTLSLHERGKLAALLEAAGAIGQQKPDAVSIV